MRPSIVLNEELDIKSQTQMVASPWEITRFSDGKYSIEVTEEFLSVTREFSQKFMDDPFSQKAYDFLKLKISPYLNRYGYRLDRCSQDIFMTLEKKTPVEEEKNSKAQLTSNLDVVPESLLTFQVEPYQKGTVSSLASVIIEDGKVVSCAQINDLCDEGEDHLELNVETAVDYRGRGYAKQTVIQLSNVLARAGFIVNYVVRKQNEISMNVALQSGFAPVKETKSMIFYRK